ncbi:MAG TPA: MaoC/PaaZ C-terminal domain-containing protein [Solirubrobacteraceae bacterium]|nr:MaoC/PaaZ C-terminal domain-containing protein [Solirubrobacteraceae bacterium]
MTVGELVPKLSRRIDLRTLVRYAGASGDFNPIHYDAEYARAAGLDGVIGHGMLAMGLLSEAITDWIGDSGLVQSISARFTSSYRLGDVLTVSGTVVGVEDGVAQLQLRCVNQDGLEVIRTASATVLAGEGSHDDV